MTPLPSHLVPATCGRRFFAGFVNLLFAGFAIMSGSAIADHAWTPARLSSRASLYAIGVVTVLWLVGVLQKKSIGAAVCLMEVRTHAGGCPSRIQMVARTAPVYLLGISGLIFDAFPDFPLIFRIVQCFIWLGLFLATVTSSMFAFITGASLFDRISGTTLVQLSLPEHMKPRLFGIRITR